LTGGASRRIGPCSPCARHLLEGTSVRSTERLVGAHRDTILGAMVEASQNCQRFLEATVRRVPVEDVQADELWGFIYAKQRTCERQGYATDDMGDAWCFVAIERTSKVVLAWHLGKHTPQDTPAFSEKLRRATSGRFQLSTDGFTPYRTNIPFVFGPRIDFAQLVKVYGNPPEGEQRYSPGEVIDTYTVIVTGTPNPGRICTSHAERPNLTMRMAIRHLTRLTNAHGKKWENHEAALALHFAYSNYCRPHTTLTEATRAPERPLVKTTPAMAAGLTDHVWSVAELLERAAAGGNGHRLVG
jgi:IS1 family transposase